MKTQDNVIGIYSDFKGFAVCVIGSDMLRKSYYFYSDHFGKTCSIVTIINIVEKIKAEFNIAKIHVNDNFLLVENLRFKNAVSVIEIDIAQNIFNLIGLIEDKRFAINPELHDSFRSEIDNFDVDIVNHRLYAVLICLKNFHHFLGPCLPAARVRKNIRRL